VAIRYKQPNAINGVSIGLIVLVGLTAWLGVSGWPVIALNSGVKNEIGDALPRVYRANLRPEPGATVEVTRIHDELETKIRALGVDDPKLVIDIARDAKQIAIEVRYHAAATLWGTKKSHAFLLRPRVETDAARVEW
jgi:hypothetical protein